MKYMTYVKLPLHLLDSCHTSVKETWSLWGVQDPIENFVVSMLMNLGGILGYSSNQMFLKGWTLKLWSWTSTKQFLSFPHLSWFKRQMYSQELSWKIPSLRPQNSYGSYGHCLSRKHLHLPEIVSPCAQILIPWSNHRRSGREEQGQEHVSHPQLQRLRWPCEWSGSSCYYEAISIVIRKRCMNIYIYTVYISFPKDLGILKHLKPSQTCYHNSMEMHGVKYQLLFLVVEVSGSLVMQPRYCWSRSFSTSVFFVGPVQKIWSRHEDMTRDPIISRCNSPYPLH